MEITTYLSNTKYEIQTFVELLNYRGQNQPDTIAYTFLKDGETQVNTLTYQELDKQARAIAATLQSLVFTGSRALLLYPSGLEFINAFFGCLYAGVIAVPAYLPRRNQNMSRLQAIIASSQAAVALTTTSSLDYLESRFTKEPELAQLPWITTDNIASDQAQAWRQPDIKSTTLALLQYTSGSTGTPKGVMVSHSNLLHNAASINESFDDTPNSQGVIWLPHYHDMGLIGGILQPLYIGMPTVLMPATMFIQKPWRWLQAISRYNATTSGGPNFAYDLCIRKITPEQRASLDLSSWEVAFTGAEPIRAETLEQFAATFADCGFRREAFHPCYGMAETTLMVSGGLRNTPPIIRQVNGEALERNQVVTATSKQEITRTIVSCGQGLLDQKIVIVDPQSLTPCPPNRVGEIWISGLSVAQGYWNQQKETEQTFHGNLGNTDDRTFLRTGDLGFVQDGELFITGRIKDVIIIRGRNHYPQDIELTVEKSHAALKSGCGAAFAVEVKGEERLVVVQEVERSYLRKLNANEVIESIRRAVTAEHALQLYAIVLVKTGSIPKTSSGKIQRHICRYRFLTGSLNVVGDWSQTAQGKSKFIHLQVEVESMLKELSTSL